MNLADFGNTKPKATKISASASTPRILPGQEAREEH